ncbi:hypothetical protein [Actinoplanes sp. NPDC026623]|uniref:hypothetical protein n=1 Tax=Actinoplanes sp. NPDC026623 TaxID=3155610 RepID=UPI0033FE3A0D
MRHRTALLSTVLAVVATTLALPGPASAVEPGFAVAITEVPAAFTAGKKARTVTVVASSEQRRCQKVRWSLILQVDGPELDEIEVARVEDGRDFPVQVQNGGADTTRITDVRLDPGQLCRGRTVTARYQIAFDEDAAAGEVIFQAQAFNARQTLLQESTARSRIDGRDGAAKPTESPSPKPSPSESATEPEQEPDDQAAAPEPTESEDDLAAVAASGSGSTPSLLGPGLIVGGVLVFLGVGLLLRLRMRGRDTKHAQPPTGFYPAR